MKTFELVDPLFLPHCGCDMQLTVAPGELLVLVGDNGIGKSTLLRRFYLTLNVNQRVVVEQKGSEYFYDRKLGVLKNIFLEAHPAGLKRETFDFLRNAFGLNLKEDRLLSHLSGGESQCLKLCLSLAKEADFYFLDEPSQYLDLHRKQVLQHFLMTLKALHKSIIVIEHNRDWLGAGVKVQELVVIEQTLRKGSEWTI